MSRDLKIFVVDPGPFITMPSGYTPYLEYVEIARPVILGTQLAKQSAVTAYPTAWEKCPVRSPT